MEGDNSHDSCLGFIILFSLICVGRDGLTHNMLDNIHAHWKRRRVCKIKCKGVCTVDMDNVCEQLEVCISCYSVFKIAVLIHTSNNLC